MGIPGILKEIGKGERIALAKLAVEHLEKTGRPFRIAIDAAIWQFQNQAAQGGTNPALRTLFYRLLKLLALPIHPIFVYDGKNRPLTKRNKTVSAYGTCIPNEMSKKLVQAFRFPYHTAPGEAEAECALLQKRGVVDAVMSQDVDTLMFGSTMTLRDWSKEGTRGNKTATHVNVLRAEETQAKTKLDPSGIILVALLSGGDYDTDGVPGFGPALTCEIAKAGFGADLLELARNGNTDGVKEWRERLQYELETNESGYFRRKHKTIRIPDNFPDPTILGYYTNPVVSSPEQLERISAKCAEIWDSEIDIPALRVYVAEKFEWLYKSGAKKLIRNLAPALLSNRLRQNLTSTTITSADSIKERRIHFVSDGMPELRLQVIPYDIVGLRLEDEEDNPAYLEQAAPKEDGLPVEAEDFVELTEQAGVDDVLASPLKTRKSPPWDPTAPEKIWVPETIAKLGIPTLVETWEQSQRDLLANPIKFASRNCAKSKPKTGGMKPGALHGFFTSSKSNTQRDVHTAISFKSATSTNIEGHLPSLTQKVPVTPSKKASQGRSGERSPTIDRYLSRSPLPPLAGLDRRKDGTIGVKLPSKARYSALGLYGSDAQSSDIGEFLSSPQNCSSGPKHSRPTSSESIRAEKRKEFSSPTTSPTIQHPRKYFTDVARTGRTVADSIEISSSPPVPRSYLTKRPTPTTPRSNARDSPPNPGSPSTPATIPASVTQRSNRRIRTRSTTRTTCAFNAQVSASTAVHRAPPPQQTPKQKRTSPLEEIATKTTTATTTANMTRSSLKTHFPTTKIKQSVLSRDSLPGTWKETDIDVEAELELEVSKQELRGSRAVHSGFRRTRKVQRVSCVDLTDR